MKLIRPALRLYLHVGVFFFSGLIASLSAQTLPANWPADYPDWWYNAADPANGVIDATQTELNQQNGAVLNQGQLWNIAQQGIDELNTQLAPVGGAGFEIDDLSNGQSPDYYAPANLGHLKAVSSRFFDRFAAVGFTPTSTGWPATLILDEGAGDNATNYPWRDNVTPDNAALANLGQAKNLFSWDFLSFSAPFVDLDSDGMHDLWEAVHALDGSEDLDPASDFDADGYTNLEEYIWGLNPIVKDGFEIEILNPTAGETIYIQ